MAVTRDDGSVHGSPVAKARTAFPSAINEYTISTSIIMLQRTHLHSEATHEARKMRLKKDTQATLHFRITTEAAETVTCDLLSPVSTVYRSSQQEECFHKADEAM